MRVGLLTYGLDRQLSGVGRVARELGRALGEVGECEIVYLTTYRNGPFRGEPGCTSRYLPGCARLPGLMLLGGPLVCIAARQLGLDLVHDPVGVSPFTLGRWAGRFKRVVTIHDAIAFRYPEGYPWLNNFLHRRYVPATLGNISGVITDSQHARMDLLHFLGLSPAQVHVVSNGVEQRFRPIAPEEARRVASNYGLTGPFVLSVGAQQARKNLDRLVAAFARLHVQLPSYRLAIAGPTQWGRATLREQIAGRGLEDAVSVLGYVSDEDLPALYSAASLFVFPSLYEGFGLPVLEAMACGTPVVCSNTASLPEVAGDAALLVDPTNTEDLADAMGQALCEPEPRATLRQKGLERAKQFTWERAARETMEVYRSVLAEG